jgi:hypothetical protein
MNEFNLEVVEDSVEEIIIWEPKSPLKEGLRYHYVSGIRGWNLLTLCQPPL